jgi:hypothetical protein
MSTRAKKLRIGACLAACAAIAAALIGANFLPGRAMQASPSTGLLDALPAGASSLVYVDLVAVRASSFYQHRPDKGPIAVPNQDYADFVRSTGFDFEKDLDRVVVASWFAPSGKDSRKDVAIAEGRFDQAKIRDYALRHGKMDHQQGREVFLFPASAQGGGTYGGSTAFFLDDHRIALVAGQRIDILLNGHSSDSSADPVRQRAARLDGAAAFAIMRVPPIPEDTGNPALQGAAGAQILSLVRSVQWITLAARPEGDNVRISLEGECDTSENAHQLQSALELLRAFGRMGLESPKTKQSMNPAALASLENVLNSAEVTQAAERVRILVELTPDIFNAAPDKPR